MTTKKEPEGWVIVDTMSAIAFCGPETWFSPASLENINLFPTYQAAFDRMKKWEFTEDCGSGESRYRVFPWPIPRSVANRLRRAGMRGFDLYNLPVSDDPPAESPKPTKGKTGTALQDAYKALIALADAAADDAFPFEKGAPKVLTPDEAQAVAKHVEAAKTLLHTIGGLVSYAKSKGVDGG